ncbi:MAG: hypothetical protein A2992_07485 [Elusimicrobia bacterium RIFCSPLOWO2_01_FULL_59_12]|nr:MAG: hypothetical protein A2992_07485 [Elusimicrobia bacterium RIFCSPLOWO2_01_FULL_59_12]
MPAHAANPDTMVFRVRAGSTAPPDAITDLLASPNPGISGQISLTWTAPQGNAGGVPIPNVTVARYTIHAATFSVDSLLGDTTSWWDSTTAGAATLQPPGYTPQSPGSLEGYTFTGLTPGATYFFGIRSTSPSDVGSPIDTQSGTPGNQVWAVATQILTPPRGPGGVLSTSLSDGLQVQLSWTPVAVDTSGSPVSISQYLIHRYAVIGSTSVATVSVPGSASSYTENTGGTVYYYRIQAVGTSGAVSAFSDYLDSSLAANRYAIASDDITTRVVMPHDAALYLLAANNPQGQDLALSITHQPQDEVDVTLRSYRVRAHRADTNAEISGFAFPQNNISVHLGYGSVVTPSQGGPVSLGSQGSIPAAVLAQIISVYWFNGANFVRVGNPLLTLDQSISVSVRNIGIYQIRAVTIGSKFRLAQGSPYPRVITPNGAENRRVFWFFDNPTGDPVQGEIYDVRGAHVCGLAVNSMSPTPNSLVWDGRDGNGAVVPSGVYLYKISTPEETITGTVVVAR